MKKNTSWYSILAALMIVGFLLILSSGVFQLVLNELNSNRARANYLQAYYGAESGVEWALLNIKNIWYGLYDTIPWDVNNRSIALWTYPTNLAEFQKRRDTLLSYTIDTKVQSFESTLTPGAHEIIPLFYLDIAGNQYDTKSLNLDVTGFPDAISWNIVGEQYGLAWVGEFEDTTDGDYKYIHNDSFRFEKKKVGSFLDVSSNNYLILFNTHPTESISYKVETNGSNFITKPVWTIFASGFIGAYKQNIKVSLDNTAYLSILKYSIFSN